MTDLIRTDHDGKIVRLTLNRAPVNALSAAFLMEYAETMRQLGDDPNVRAIVIDSAFSVYSAGLDLKAAVDFGVDEQAAIVRGLNVGFLAQYECPSPVVAAVNGAAIAGGLFFVLAADARVGTARTRLGLAEVQVGVDLPVGPMEIARAALAPDDLRLLMLGGHPINGEEARKRGILDDLVTPEDLQSAALAAAARLAQHPPKAFAAIKRQIRGAVCDRIRAAASEDSGPWFSDETEAAMRRMIG